MFSIKSTTQQDTGADSTQRLTLRILNQYLNDETEVTVTTKDRGWLGEGFTKTGKITKITEFGCEDDGIIWLENYSFGIYLRNINSLYARHLILNASESDTSKGFSLRAGGYSVIVDKELLKEKSSYFDKMFSIGMKESTIQEIDLGATFDEASLKLLIEHLNKPSKPILNAEEALNLLVSADILCDKKLINKSIEALSHRVYNARLLNSLVTSHPLISNLITSLRAWSRAYPRLDVTTLIKKYAEKFLQIDDVNSYHDNLLMCCEHLLNLTGTKWTFDGSKVISERIDTHYPDEPKHINKLNEKIIENLIARGFLIGKEEPLDTWTCDFTDKNLLSLEREQVVSEIEEASDLIALVTGKPCCYLNLYPVLDGSDYQVLEEIGCISNAKYYAFNVNISNFDLEKLNILCEKGITLPEINKRINLIKKSAEPNDLFKQVINFCETMSLPRISGSALSFYARSESSTEENQTPRFDM